MSADTATAVHNAQDAGEDIRVLTLREPFASLVAWGVKTIETRKRGASHRGLLAIHAALGTPIGCATRYVAKLYKAQEGRADWTFKNVSEGVDATMAQGCIIAVATLVEVRDLVPGDEDAACFYARHRKAWVLEDVIRLVPLPHRGMQGLGRVDARKLVAATRNVFPGGSS